MMGRWVFIVRKKYDIEMLKQINENTDLIAYAGQTMELKKKGKEYFAHCPKHKDDTPSLSFTPENNLYHCFSCGCSGGIINFLRDFEGLDFDQAVEKAAKLANVDLSKMCQSDTVLFLKQVHTINQRRKEKKYVHKVLNKREYQNKYRHEVIPEWLSEGMKQEVMDLFGVRVDKVHNRIVYPVCDIKGNLINVKGRTRFKAYKELKIPKYINYFKVGVMDYFQGLDITLNEVKKKNEVIVFESVKSVIKAYGWGYKNCVSAEKHTLTNEQVTLLVKLKCNVVFAYDADVDYWGRDVKQSIDKLKQITNVYIIRDRDGVLGGADSKNAPVDMGKEIWEELYADKKKVVAH